MCIRDRAIAYPVLRERISRGQLAGITLGAVSVCIIVSEKISLGGSLIVYSLPFLSVLSLTLASVLSRYSESRCASVSREKTPLFIVLLIQCSIACIGFFILAWNFGSFSVNLVPGFFISLTYMSVVVSIGSYFLYFLLLRELSAVKASSLVYLTPPVTMVLGWIWFRESLSVTDLLGLVLALIAVLLIIRNATPIRLKKSYELRNSTSIQRRIASGKE